MKLSRLVLPVSGVAAGLLLVGCTTQSAAPPASSSAASSGGASASPSVSPSSSVSTFGAAYCDDLVAASNAKDAFTANPEDVQQVAEYSRYVGEAAVTAPGDLGEWLAALSEVMSPDVEPSEEQTAFVLVHAGRHLKQIEKTCGVAI